MTQDTTIHQVVRTFRACDTSSATIAVLANGQALRIGATGAMLLASVGGDFVRYLGTQDRVIFTGAAS